MSAVTVLLLTCLPIFQICGQEVYKLEYFPGFPPSGIRLGHSVSLDGDTIVVGAPDQGGVYVYRKSLRTWVGITTFFPPGVGQLQEEGFAVKIDQNTLLVGAPGTDQVANNDGSVFVYVGGGATWNLQALLTANDPATSRRFGWSIGLEGDRAVVGAPNDDVIPNGPGRAYVFERSGTQWTETAVLQPGGVKGDQIGFSVDLEGDTIVLGAPVYKFANGTGSAHVFIKSGASWAQQATLLASDGQVDDRFGNSVALLGDRIAVGAPQTGSITAGPGACYIFERTGTAWIEVAKLVARDGEVFDGFGWSVALDSEILAVGAHGDDDGPHLAAGAVYTFRRSGSAWYEQTKENASDGFTLDWLGYSIDLQGAEIVAGAPSTESNNATGASYVFRVEKRVGAILCLGDGIGAACPCANESRPCSNEGCVNSTGHGGILAAKGSQSVALDDLGFVAPGLPPGQSAVLIAGLGVEAGGLGTPFGNGLICVKDVTLSLGSFSAPLGTAQWGPGLATQGGWSAGDTVNFQVRYRDQWGSPCGTLVNGTPAVSVTFAP